VGGRKGRKEERRGEKQEAFISGSAKKQNATAVFFSPLLSLFPFSNNISARSEKKRSPPPHLARNCRPGRHNGRDMR
jgi:hypothetical protein